MYPGSSTTTTRGRRGALALSFALAILIPNYAGVARSAAVVADPRPNILIVMTDDQRGGLAVMPQTKAWLKEGGVRYPKAISTTPTCCPSRASLVTGLYAHNHGVLKNGGSSGALLDQSLTLQSVLQADGYRTGFFGKFLHGIPLHVDPKYFDSWAVAKSGTYYNGEWNVDGTQLTVPTYSTEFIDQQVKAFTGVAPDAPWFAIAAPHAPHGPWTPAVQYADAPISEWKGNPAVFEKDRSDKPPWVRRRAATFERGSAHREMQLRTLLSVDDMMASIHDHLELTGQLDNTLVFYLSDNGYLWSEHRLQGKDHPYLQSVRVPFLASWPGHLPAGQTSQRLVANIDIAPTVYAASGSSPPVELDGRSLLDAEWDHRRIHAEHWCNVNICRYWASTIRRRSQYIEYYTTASMKTLAFREFYRLDKDPWQLVNLLRDGKPGNVPNLKALHERVKMDLTCSGTECP
jgi:arylsulfatase A-like enzyme